MRCAVRSRQVVAARRANEATAAKVRQVLALKSRRRHLRGWRAVHLARLVFKAHALRAPHRLFLEWRKVTVVFCLTLVVVPFLACSVFLAFLGRFAGSISAGARITEGCVVWARLDQFLC